MAAPLRIASGGSSYIKSLSKSRRQYGTAPMPDLVQFQLGQPVDEPPRGPDWVHEMKFDGYRMQALCGNGHRASGRTSIDAWAAKRFLIASGG